MSEGLGDYIGANPSAEYITREAAFRILFRALSDPRGENWNRIRHSVREIPVTYELPFEDVDSLSGGSIIPIRSLWQHRILTGNSTRYLWPARPIRREDVATMLFNAGTPLGALLDGVEIVRPDLTTGFEPLALDPGYLDSSSNIQGAQAFQFLATESGYYTFTASRGFAPMLFETATYPDNPDAVVFPPIHIIPQRVDTIGEHFQVRRYIPADTIVVAAVSGGANNDFRITVEKSVRYVRPVRVDVQSIAAGTGREFRNARADGRLHAGIDFTPYPMHRASYAPGDSSLVYAVADGRVLRYAHFHDGTYALEVLKDSGRIVRYGEVFALPGIVAGARVEQGTPIARMGRWGSNPTLFMLHLEYFSGSAGSNVLQGAHLLSYRNAYEEYDYVTPGDFRRRRDLLDPTNTFGNLPN